MVKGNVTLSCSSTQGKPVPQYKWTKAAPASEVFFSPMQSESSSSGWTHSSKLSPQEKPSLRKLRLFF